MKTTKRNGEGEKQPSLKRTGKENERALPIFSNCVHLNGEKESEQAKAAAIAVGETEQRPDHIIPDRRIKDGLGVLIGTAGARDDLGRVRLHGQTNPPLTNGDLLRKTPSLRAVELALR